VKRSPVGRFLPAPRYWCISLRSCTLRLRRLCANPASHRWNALAGLLLASLLAALRLPRIPAIDPTGQGLFAGTTTIEPHGLFHKHGGHRQSPSHQRFPQPVAVQPAVVQPPCTAVAGTSRRASAAARGGAAVPIIPVGCGPSRCCHDALPRLLPAVSSLSPANCRPRPRIEGPPTASSPRSPR
jgi:hypothetical protein